MNGDKYEYIYKSLTKVSLVVCSLIKLFFFVLFSMYFHVFFLFLYHVSW